MAEPKSSRACLQFASGPNNLATALQLQGDASNFFPPPPPPPPPPPRRTRHIMFRTRLRIPRQGLSLGLRTTVNARRSLHQVPSLPHDYSQGIPNLMSPGGFAVAWTDYMSLMVEKLNALTTGRFCSSSLPLRHGFARATAARSCSPIAQAPQLTAFHL